MALLRKEGEIYGTWKLLTYEGSRLNYGKKERFWSCQCVHCGKISSKTVVELNKKATSSCVCTTVVKDAAYRMGFRLYRTRAKKGNFDFDINLEDFKKITILPCHYCGRLPEVNCYSYASKIPIPMNGIDRVDSSLGYVLSNCVPCCKQCNTAKLDNTKTDFLSWVFETSGFQTKRLLTSVNKEPGVLVSEGVFPPEEELEWGNQ